MARLLKPAPPLATATFALMTAAWAATGDVPLAPGARTAEPLAVAAAATGPLVADDHDGIAVLTAPAMAPGATAAGQVTISNAGDAAGRFSVAAGAPGVAGGGAGGVGRAVCLDGWGEGRAAPGGAVVRARPDGERRDGRHAGGALRRQARRLPRPGARDVRAARGAPLPLRGRIPRRADGGDGRPLPGRVDRARPHMDGDG